MVATNCSHQYKNLISFSVMCLPKHWYEQEPYMLKSSRIVIVAMPVIWLPWKITHNFMKYVVLWRSFCVAPDPHCDAQIVFYCFTIMTLERTNMMISVLCSNPPGSSLYSFVLYPTLAFLSNQVRVVPSYPGGICSKNPSGYSTLWMVPTDPYVCYSFFLYIHLDDKV